MSYFSRFPLVEYNGLLQVNLTRRTSVIDSMRSNPAFYINYSIPDGESPEMLADKIYDDAECSWVILMFNNIMNIFEEWPKSQYSLGEYIKYNYDSPSGIHHWVALSTDAIVDPATYPGYDRRPVTNYEYETSLNDQKRNIKVLLPQYVGDVKLLHKEMMQK